MAEIILPEVELNIYTPRNPFEATVVENRIVTREASPNIVRHMTFDISGSELLNRWKVGQSLGVLPPGTDERGRAHKLRLYSISSPGCGEGGESHLVSTTVKRTIEELNGRLYLGVASNYLADLQPGERVKLTGPSGKRFLLPVNAHDYNYLFIATGTGIAPFRGMIQELFGIHHGAQHQTDHQPGQHPTGQHQAGQHPTGQHPTGQHQPYQKQCVLLFGCPYRTDLLYADYFAELAREHSNFHYLTCVSREGRRPDGSKHYVQTRLADERELLGPILSRPDTLIYICGLKGMEEGIYRELIRQELFGYFEFRNGAPDEPRLPEGADLRTLVRPSPRLFEEVY